MVHSSVRIDEVVMAFAVLALLASLGYAASYSTATLNVLCWSGNITLSTDAATYSVSDTANMTVNLTDFMNVSLNEYLLLDLYNSSGKIKTLAHDNATLSPNSTNTTSYYSSFGTDLETGSYWIRAEVVNLSYYPSQNKTLIDCSANLMISDVNITLLGARPNPPTNLTIILVNNSTGEVKLDWSLSNSTNITNYLIYRISDHDQGFNFSNPYTTVSNTTSNYSDFGSVNYDELYYIVRANNTLGLTDTNTYTVAKFNLKMYTGWNMIAFPILLYNYSADNVTYNAENNDEMWRYNANATGDPYDRTDYYAGFGWFGDFTQLELDRGYWYKSQKSGYTSSPFNLTVVGVVAAQSRTQTMYTNWNLIGIASPDTWNADTLFTGETNGDMLWRYNANATGDPYDRTDYYAGFGWFGDFTNVDPGRGYWYKSENGSAYNWTYAP